MENFPLRPQAPPGTAPGLPSTLYRSNKFWQFLASVRSRPTLWKAVNYAGRLGYLNSKYSIPAALIAYAKKVTGRSSIAYELMARMLKKRGFGKRKQIPLPAVNRPAKRRKFGGNGPITTQSDFRQTGGKKRLTKRQKKWKSFVKKVHKATDQNDKTHFLQEAHDTDLTITGTAGVQFQQLAGTNAVAGDINLQLSAVGNSATGPLRFVTNLIQQKSVSTVAAGTTATATPLKDVKYKLLGASCTFSIKNQMAYNMYIDIYECVAAAHIIDSTFSTARAAWINCLALNAQTDQTLGFTKLSVSQSGSTPYQAPGFGRYWKIIKKTRVLTVPGSITNYTFFTRKKFVNNSIEISRYATKGLTKDIILVANPTFNGDTTVASIFDLEWSKSYAVKMDDMPGLQAQWAYQAVD